MTGSKDNTKTPASGKKSEKKRAQPGDFERQVEQIRRDIDTVRSNLAAAEKALQMSKTGLTEEPNDEMKTEDNEAT